MKYLLAATTFLALTGAAHAVQIISFGQTSSSNTVVGTANGAGTATTIQISDATIIIDQLLGAVTPINAFLDLTANSIDAAVGIGPALLQHYSGTFSITSGAGDTGTNYLSGTFSDAAFGLQTGEELSVNVANPPDTLSLTSGVVPAAELSPPNAFALSMTGVTPALTLDNATIGSFDASFSGVASASVPEPAALALFGFGLLGLTAVRLRRS